MKPDSAVKAGEDSNSKGFVFGQSKTDKSISSITKPDEGKPSSISGITTTSTSVTSALASTGKMEDKPAIGKLIVKCVTSWFIGSILPFPQGGCEKMICGVFPIDYFRT